MIFRSVTRDVRRLFLIAVAVACAVGPSRPLCSQEAAEETVTFGFGPPDRATFVETTKWTRTVKADGEPLSADEKQGRREYHLRRTGTGYSVTVKPLQAPVEASRELGLTIQDLFARAALTYQLDPQGQLVRVVGADEAMRKVFEVLPEKEQSLFKDLFAMMTQGKSATELAAAAWSGRAVLGMFVGRTLSLGKPYRSVGSVPLPIGVTATADITVEIMRPSECATPQCVAISVKYQGRDQKLGAALSKFARGALLHTLRESDTPGYRARRRREGAPVDLEKLVPAFQYGDFSMEGETIRLLDVTTGLPQSEMSLQTIRGNVQVEGKTATFELTETHRNNYRRSLLRLRDKSAP